MKKNFGILNLIRIILAISIVMWHSGGCFMNFWYTNFSFFTKWRNLTPIGGNQAFFMISGLLFYFSTYQRYESSDINAWKFLKKKVLRLYPLTIIATLFSFFISMLEYIIFKGDYTLNIWLLIKDLIFFGNTIFEYGYATYNHPIWYLAGLLICYCVCAFIMAVTKNKKSEKWFLIPLLL